jgi:hypothetical protein
MKEKSKTARLPILSDWHKNSSQADLLAFCCVVGKKNSG